jgi:PTH2 family peptidyl-tRNA hydrolase
MANVRIVYNGNIKMSPGKLAAQAVHAALAAYGIDHGSVVVLQGSVRKVETMDVQIRDAGLTELKPGTLTAGATLEKVEGFDED